MNARDVIKRYDYNLAMIKYPKTEFWLYKGGLFMSATVYAHIDTSLAQNTCQRDTLRESVEHDCSKMCLLQFLSFKE